MRKYDTPQEEFWAGDFGKDYISRNEGEELLASNLKFSPQHSSMLPIFHPALSSVPTSACI